MRQRQHTQPTSTAARAANLYTNPGVVAHTTLWRAFALPPMTPLSTYSADHRFLVEAGAKAAGLTDPVAFVAAGYAYSLVGNAVRGALVPIDGALIRQWVTRSKYYPATAFGIRLYQLEGIPFARCVANGDTDYDQRAYDVVL